MLFIIKKYQAHQTKLLSKLLFDQNVAMLFVAEGIFYLLDDDSKPSKAQVYALKDSVLLFGLTERIPSSVRLVDYSDWISLTEKYDKITTLG